MTRLVVGLGNPGPEYEWTRHNVGFHVLDRILSSSSKGQLFRSARQLEGYHGPRAFKWARLEEPDVFLLRPETFMNRSGDVVAPVARFLAEEPDEWLDPARILVVYDDLDLDLGRLRIRPHGGHGGQNGMRSILSRLETDRFPRLRVGIGPSGTDAARHVLSPFPPKQRVEAEISVAEAAEAILDWLRSGDLELCMTRYHSRWNQES
jgi:peptidyl-tRNA hydrolase, PTH1 family